MVSFGEMENRGDWLLTRASKAILDGDEGESFVITTPSASLSAPVTSRSAPNASDLLANGPSVGP